MNISLQIKPKARRRAHAQNKHLELVLQFLPETVQCILHRQIVQIQSPANR